LAHPLETWRSLARRRGVQAAAVALPILGVLAGGLPLLDAAGYELGEAGALLAALVLAPWLGISAARLERARPSPSPWRAFASAAALVAALVALFFAGVVARAALGPCRVLAAAWFLPALGGPSLLLGCAVAVGASLVAGGRRGLAGALYGTALLLSLAFTVRRAFLGPAAYVLDPFLGYFPGPLYDEAVALDARVVWAAARTTAWAFAVVAAASAALRLHAARGLAGDAPAAVGRGALRRSLATLAVAAATVVGVSLASGRSALEPPSASRGRVAAELGGRLEGARCTLHFPAEKPAVTAAALLDECELHVADVARALGVEVPPRVTVFIYRSADEKRRLVGAAYTDYTKPWIAEIHLGDQPLPHPVLRHEIVHAVASVIAPGPFRVPARGLILPSMALVEGLAVALEVPRSAWTVHEWSHAAREQGFLPDVARLLGPAGFWSQAPARAYTAAGSFLAFLLERHGAAPVRAAYASGDLEAAFGQPLPALVAEWQAFLDGVAIPDGLRAATQARMTRPAIFARPCAREVADVEGAAARAAGAGQVDEACALYDRVAALTGSAGALKARGDVLARAGELPRALDAYRDARARAPEDDRALRAALLGAEGDVLWREDDVAGASAAWLQVLATHPERAEARLYLAKLTAAPDPALGPAARPYLLGLEDTGPALARLARVEHPLSAYLVARQAWARGDAAAAVPGLGRAAGAGLPPAIDREARLLLGEARCRAGDVAAGAAALDALRGGDATPADLERTDAALRRCAFERTRRGRG
jgi:tetratricopeptide (TPR) repeat protein